MAKFCGKIGYAILVDDGHGVWTEEIIEKNHSGDLYRNIRRLQSSGNLNDNVVLSNEISIIANPYARQNFHSMRYVEFMGAKWKISNVDVQYPRLVLTLGEIYND
jgi:hypothetical protein